MSPYSWAMLAALCWGFAPLFEKAGLKGTSDPSVGVLVRTLGVVAGALCYGPFCSRLTSRLAALPLRQWLFLGIGGLLASIVGQLCFYRALKFGEISRVVPLGAAYPLIACVMGLLFWDEALTASKTLGILFVMAGVYLLK